MSTLREEIEKRRTFAIISHPDAGKTTLTEKFLLYGGAIQLAGAVKGKKNARAATSDWMEIEKQRGISVTSSVMQFNFEGYCINILDTPGHQDFSEDTYRTLMAADSAVMVIDAAKGVEAQTRKLFKVCVMRDIPIFTFINKMDREARDPFDLLDEIEKELGIGTVPVNWPIGCGKDFKGVYDRRRKEILYFTGSGTANGQKDVKGEELDLQDEKLKEVLGDSLYEKLCEDVELLDGAAEPFDLERIRHGKLSPVFFGSALTNFGVEPFLHEFLQMTTPPLPRTTAEGIVDPFDDRFSAFVFKIQANMNKAHRDRIAFIRLCSGKFEKGMEVCHVQENYKKMRLSQPQQLMAQEREIIDEAYAGDIHRHLRPRHLLDRRHPLRTRDEGAVRGDPDLRAGALRPGLPAGHDGPEAVCQRHLPDCPGGRDPDLPGARPRDGRGHRRGRRHLAVRRPQIPAEK